MGHNTPRSLLDLPIEIREHIYHYLLCDNDGPLSIEQANTELQLPPLTQTCRLIRAETLDIFYGKNVFHTTIYKRHVHSGPPFRMHGFNAIWRGDDLMLWLSLMGEENVARLKTIIFWGHNFGVKASFTNEDRFRLCRIEEASNQQQERNIISDCREAIEKEIMSVDMHYIPRCEYICWIRDKLFDLAGHEPNQGLPCSRDSPEPSKSQTDMPKDSKLRLELLLFK